jgi:hypothetical protein
MTQKEKFELVEQFLYRLNFHRTVSMNEKKVDALLELADKWVMANVGTGSKVRTEKEIKKNSDDAYELFRNLP